MHKQNPTTDGTSSEYKILFHKASLSLGLALVSMAAVALLESSHANAMGRRLPSEQPSQPAQPPPRPINPEPGAIPSITPAGFDVFVHTTPFTNAQVESRFTGAQLTRLRNPQVSAHRTDSCDLRIINRHNFGDRIAAMVDLGMQPRLADFTPYIAELFELSRTRSGEGPTGLLSHPLCLHTTESMKHTLFPKHQLNSNTLALANEFATRMNGFRRDAIAGNFEAYVNASRLWTRFFQCLGFSESFPTADSSSSFDVARRNAPSDYRKPAGVNFYEDPLQNSESRLNIGTYQFTPSAGGNIQSCIRTWNRTYPNCPIATNSPSQEMIRILGSSLQTFNAFCGIVKVSDMFYVQANTRGLSRTHPANFPGGNLTPSDNRCVTPHFRHDKSYNHFGPLQNGLGRTLEPLLRCALNR